MKKIFTALTLTTCLLSFNTLSSAAPYEQYQPQYQYESPGYERSNYDNVHAPTRIKDIAKIQGVRDNQLVGYGLVVGLAGTGDSSQSAMETVYSTIAMLQSFGISISTAGVSPDNVAAVMVTATLPPFVREGDNIDVTVSSIGDADSIQGGTLLQTPLRAADGNIYAVAQGAVSTGGFMAGNGGGTRVQANYPTVGTTVNGAIVERTVEDDIGTKGELSLSLSKNDFTTASRIAGAINSVYGGIAHAANPSRVDILIPPRYRNHVVDFISNIENLSVVPDSVAKVVFNERTGTIVMGGNVSVDECAITQGGITVRVSTDTEINVIQPSPYSFGTTVVTATENEDVDVVERDAKSIVMPATTDINDIIGALNAVGATARDCISILQALHAAGAIHANVEII